MATTRLMPRHVDEGHSILQSISDSLTYGQDLKKTRDGNLVSSYECNPRMAAEEFVLAKKQYAALTGREQRKDKDVLLYQLRQSFRPGEISPEEANRLSYELALSFTKGRHAFIVCTHEDKEHIHSHIYFNSTALDCKRKFRNFWGSSFAIRRISDRICIENNYSIVEKPKPTEKRRKIWGQDENHLSGQEKLRRAIDTVLEQKPSDFQAFIEAMIVAGFTVDDSGKHLKFLVPGMEKHTRCDTLKGDYTVQAIKERIEGKRIVTPRQKSDPKAEISSVPKVNLLIDIENSIKAKESPGYEQWAKVFNVKQAAKTLMFLQQNNLTDYDKLAEETEQGTKRFNEISARIKPAEARLAEISEFQKYISNYSRTRDVYIKYRESGYSKKFLEEHEGDIILHQAAKKFFDKQKLKKLPTIKDLKAEYAALLAEKKKMYSDYHSSKEKMRELATAKANTDRLLGFNSGLSHDGNERGTR